MQDIQDKSAMQEFSHSFTSTPFNSLNGEISVDNGNQKQKENDKNAIHRRSLVESKLQEFEIEMERLSSRIEHLRSQNEVLNLSLEESKNQCDNLTVLIGNCFKSFILLKGTYDCTSKTRTDTVFSSP